MTSLSGTAQVPKSRVPLAHGSGSRLSVPLTQPLSLFVLQTGGKV